MLFDTIYTNIIQMFCNEIEGMIENFFVNERSFDDKLLIWKNKKLQKNDWIFGSVNRNENQLIEL